MCGAVTGPEVQEPPTSTRLGPRSTPPDSPPTELSGCLGVSAPPAHAVAADTVVMRNDNVSDPKGTTQHLSPLCPGGGGDQCDTAGADEIAGLLGECIGIDQLLP
jgi:hypothetical protein